MTDDFIPRVNSSEAKLVEGIKGLVEPVFDDPEQAVRVASGLVNFPDGSIMVTVGTVATSFLNSVSEVFQAVARAEEAAAEGEAE